MKIEAVIVGTLLFVVGCATDQVQPAANAATTNAPVVASDAQGAESASNVRCEYRPVLGSRVGQKICHSEEQWALLERHEKQQMKYIDDRTKSSPYTDRYDGD